MTTILNTEAHPRLSTNEGFFAIDRRAYDPPHCLPGAKAILATAAVRRGAAMTAALAAGPFAIGDPVRKRAGYEYPGFIVSVFTTRAGVVRYVVEADHPSFIGMLHIFNEEQLERRQVLAADSRPF
jgi:hypothetical protein